MRIFIFFIFLASTLASITGCIKYHPQPLNSEFHYSTLSSGQRLTEDFSRIWPTLPRAHLFDPSDGLDMEEVAMFAVSNNAQLKVARALAGVTYAQAFAAGLLPDPQVAYGKEFVNKGQEGQTGFNAGIAMDISSLILRSSLREEGRQESKRADLEVLWQEWQLATQSKLVYLRIIALEQQATILQRSKDLFASRYQHASQAFASGNITLPAVSADLAALHNVTQRLHDIERQVLSLRYSLNSLLGLSPETSVTLTAIALLEPANKQAAVEKIDPAQIESSLKQLAQRRPDLLALQRGYLGSEARLHQAVLSQFQAIGMAFNIARDTSALLTHGFALSLALPIFNRNQGGIAVAKANRQYLNEDFRLRLAAADSELHQLLADGQLLEAQLAEIEIGLTDANKAASHMQQAARAHQMDELSYILLAATAADKQQQRLVLAETLMEQRIALQTLLGTDMPDATTSLNKNTR
jgi:outer membrane protein TolC